MIPRALVVAVLGVLAACYGRKIDRCRITCTDTCPEEETCASDGFCHAADDLALCGAVDAALDDAVALDGARDASDLDASDPDGGGGDGGPVDGGPIDGAGPDGGVIIGQAVAVAAAADHTCAIDDAATLWCWGRNLDGEVGDGSGLARVATPQQVATGVTAVATGPRHSCAIASGRVVCWGRNLDGESGQPLVGAVSTPAEVTGAGTGWVAIAVGDHHSCGIKQLAAQELRAYCWGGDARGARGNGATVVNGPSLTEVAGGLTTWSSVTAAGDHACGVAGGRGYCWGDNTGGQLGVGDLVDRDQPTQVAAGDNPSRQYEVVATGAATTCALRSGGLYCWGDNSARLFGDTSASTSAPHAVASVGSSWTQIAVAASIGCGVRAGALLCWGGGGRGAIGDGAFLDRTAPTAVVGLTAITSVAVGGDHTCAVAGGQAWCWGDDASGQLGDGAMSALYAPTQVTAMTGWVDVATASGHTCATRAGATRTELWCWGANDAREVDPTAAIGATIAAPVEVLATRDWAEVAAGQSHTCALERVGADRALWCWGANGRGQVGTGAAGPVQAPAMITLPAISDWAALVAGGDSACALSGGARYCWGANDRGQLGLGDQVDRTRPAAASAAWQALALGRVFGCGLDTTAQVWCWGDDGRGQLGLGAGDQSTPTPTQVDPGPRVAIGAGAAHAGALATGGLASWGDNRAGQTGHPATPMIDAPAAVGSTAGWTAVVGGDAHSCAITDAGRLACWGSNDRGQLGFAQASTATPTLVGSATWTALAAGGSHTCGITGGQLRCWGDNARGQVGVGANARPAPVAVLLP